MYFDALENFQRGNLSAVSPLWLNHFRTTGRPDVSSFSAWKAGVQNSIVTGTIAHVQGDMATALERAYRSYVAKYCLSNVPFETDAPRKLADAIEEFKKKRADAETELAQSLSKDLAASPFNVESAIEKHKAWKAKDDALAAKIKTAEELQPIIQRRIDELKNTQPEVLKAVLQRKLEQLEKEAAGEKDKAALLKAQIDSLKALLTELEKSASTAAAKSKA